MGPDGAKTTSRNLLAENILSRVPRVVCSRSAVEMGEQCAASVRPCQPGLPAPVWSSYGLAPCFPCQPFYLSPFALLKQNTSDWAAFTDQKLVSHSSESWKPRVLAGALSRKGLLSASKVVPCYSVVQRGGVPCPYLTYQRGWKVIERALLSGPESHPWQQSPQD